MNVKKFIVFLTILFISYFSIRINAQEFALGCKIETIDSNLVSFKKFKKSRGGLPSSYSLLSYAPEVGDQGQLESCTSWATAYCAMTIVKRIESNNPYLSSFSPMNLHNRLKVYRDEDPCSGSSYITDALYLLKNYGCASNYNEVCGYESAFNNYNDKLFSYEFLSINTSDFKQSINENSPVVIAAYYYKNGWGASTNLYDGVWNGFNTGTEEGAHAMTIIGYDDYKSGGAFLVQNSWGTSWGSNGRFWIKYSDINKVIYQALSVSPNPEAKDNNNYSNNYESDDDIHADYFRFYNNCSLTVYVTLSQYVDDIWKTIGWYAINSGSSVDLDISDRGANNVYWMATAVNNGNYVDWVDNSNGTSMCFDRINAHEIYDNSSSNCPNVANFYVDLPTSGEIYHTRTLTCPNVSTRGGDIEIKAEIKSVKLSADAPQIANKNWNGETTLFDILSGRIIEPITDASGNDLYVVYYLKGNKVKKFSGYKNELIKLTYYKFSSEKNATNWKKIKK